MKFFQWPNVLRSFIKQYFFHSISSNDWLSKCLLLNYYYYRCGRSIIIIINNKTPVWDGRFECEPDASFLLHINGFINYFYSILARLKYGLARHITSVSVIYANLIFIRLLPQYIDTFTYRKLITGDWCIFFHQHNDRKNQFSISIGKLAFENESMKKKKMNEIYMYNKRQSVIRLMRSTKLVYHKLI